MTHDDDMVKFKLYYPKDDTVDNRVGISMKYKGIDFYAILPDNPEGLEDVKLLVRNFPEVLRLAGEERKIQEEVRGMSAEIDKFLGDSE